MMRASAVEYRFRYLVHTLIYVLGFFAPWERYTGFSLGSSSWWLLLASLPAREHWLTFTSASRLVLVGGCLAAISAAFLRVWGAAYLGGGVVQSGAMHGERLLADGPFRHVRNPLYLGTFLNTLALALLMPPTGAMLTIVLIGIVQLRLIGAEERFLADRFGTAYRRYCVEVPRLLPTLRARVPKGGSRPNYLAGVLSEIFVPGVAISFVALGSSYNSTLLLKGILISFGASLVAKAFTPAVAKADPSAGSTG